MSPEPLLPEPSPLPKLHEFMPAVLSYLSDGSVHTSKEIRSAVAEALGLSSRQLAAKLPSGRLVYADRTYWAYKYLEQWGAVKSPQHARFVITYKGLDLMGCLPKLPWKLRALVVHGPSALKVHEYRHKLGG